MTQHSDHVQLLYCLVRAHYGIPFHGWCLMSTRGRAANILGFLAAQKKG